MSKTNMGLFECVGAAPTLFFNAGEYASCAVCPLKEWCLEAKEKLFKAFEALKTEKTEALLLPNLKK